MSNKENERSFKKGLGRSFLELIAGSFLTKDKFLGQLPFLLYITFLLIVYVGYSYHTEKSIRNLHKTNKDLKELRSEFITVKSKLMYETKRSEIVKSTKSLGLHESRIPPEKLVIGEKNEKGLTNEKNERFANIE
ncbi:MAG: FtsL-like putative cell division protein [Flavobacteriales bacterium]